MKNITKESKIRAGGYLLFLVVPLLLLVWFGWKIAATYFLAMYGYGCIRMIFNNTKKKGSK